MILALTFCIDLFTQVLCKLQAVTCLAFAQHSGGLLLSGGEDTVAAAWLLMDVMDAGLSQQAMQQYPPAPLYSWSAPALVPHTTLCSYNSCPVTLITYGHSS